MDLVDLKNDEHRLEYIKSDDVPLPDPGIRWHIQGTDRCVQLLTHASRRVMPKNRDGVMAVTLENQPKHPEWIVKET